MDSTFEKLDQKIREARDQLMGQEEALRSAVHRLDEDVETKLDKGELEPLKDYFGQWHSYTLQQFSYNYTVDMMILYFSEKGHFTWNKCVYVYL